MSASYRPPIRVRVARLFLRPLFRAIFRLVSQVTIDGWENIPKSGAYLIAANHVSLYDPPLVLSFWPVAAEAAGAVEVWQRPGQSLIVSWYGVIPVHRGAYDRHLLETLEAALASGRPVLILPEGSRSHTPGMRRAAPGTAYLVEKSGVPVVPVGVAGTTDDFLPRALRGQRPRVHMSIGIPFYLPRVEHKGDARRIARQRNADLIMTHIAAILPSEYRGVYADPSGILD